MIIEDYVSFETAKLLKENGFNEWCYKCYGTAVYHKGVPISFDEECELKSDGLGDEIEYVEGGCLYDFGCDNREKETNVWAAPTLQMAMKWLREEEQLYVMLDFERPSCIEYKIYKYKSEIGRKDLLYYRYEDSYEAACEAAIKYCLENLI